jgi:hypothetical protein
VPGAGSVVRRKERRVIPDEKRCDQTGRRSHDRQRETRLLPGFLNGGVAAYSLSKAEHELVSGLPYLVASLMTACLLAAIQGRLKRPTLRRTSRTD